MPGGTTRGARPGWVRDVPIPRALDELHGPLHGEVGLPARVFRSGPNPRAVRWGLADPGRRRDLYEIVLIEGDIEDIRELVSGPEPVRYLPPWVRSAWQPVIDTAHPSTTGALGSTRPATDRRHRRTSPVAGAEDLEVAQGAPAGDADHRAIIGHG